MLVPLSWLKDFVVIDLSPEKLAEELLLSGTKVEETIKKGNDHILDLEITSNRPDCLSVYGIAREISAFTDKPLKEQLSKSYSIDEETKDYEFKVSDPALLPSYAVVVFDDIQIKASSSLIKERLEKSGIRSLLNIIDITNYVMLETGQPMHAFDYDQISGHVLNLRESEEGERVTPIDGIERTLKAGTIIIEDNEKLIDLAGIMGGKNTEVTKNTKKVLLLIPVFDPVKIRKTSLHLGMRTESSNRLEKLLDLDGPAKVLGQVIELVEEECGGQLVAKPEVVISPQSAQPIEFDLNLIPKVLGAEIPEEKVASILKSLGFEVVNLPLSKIPTLQVTPPSFRRDVNIPEDLLEEVGRIYGYNNFPNTLPGGTPPARIETRDYENIIRTTLSDWGFLECVGYTLVSKESIEKLGIESSKCAKVLSPMSKDFEYLRPTHLIGLLTCADQNQKSGSDYPYFEIGRVFIERFTQENLLTNQPKKLSGIYPSNDFFTVKGVLENLLSKFKINSDLTYSPAEISYLRDKLSSQIIIKDQKIGILGKLEDRVAKSFDCLGEWYFFEFDLEKTLAFTKETIEFRALPKFPPVVQDISVLLSNQISVQELMKTVTTNADPLLVSTEIIDIYSQGDKKSVTLRLTFQSSERTLKESEVNSLRISLVERLKESLGAEIRS